MKKYSKQKGISSSTKKAVLTFNRSLLRLEDLSHDKTVELKNQADIPVSENRLN